MIKPTKLQKKVLDFIKHYWNFCGTSPALREIQGEFGWESIGAVQRHVDALIKKGYLRRGQVKRLTRGLIVVEEKCD